MPTFQCHKYGLNFTRVAKAWGIEQNLGDEFRGEEISILYDPGEFPALLTAATTEAVPRNGGVPQEGSLMHHLKLFQMHMEKLVLPGFKGNWAALLWTLTEHILSEDTVSLRRPSLRYRRFILTYLLIRP